MKKALIITLLLLQQIFGQHITNTLGSMGTFRIKDNSSTFLSLDQSTGVLSLNRNFNLLNTANSSAGVIMKNSAPFIHDYTSPGTDGNNTFVGINSGNFSMGGAVNTYGSYNTALGKNTLTRNGTGSYNTSIGYLTLNQNTSGLLNTAIGSYSLNLNVSGSFNTSLGASSLYNNTTGSRNIAVGCFSLHNDISGFNNISIGYMSQYYLDFSNDNLSIGNYSLYKNRSSDNLAIGMYSMYENTEGYSNSAVGHNSLRSNTTGYWNTACGINVLNSNTSGSFNSGFGSNSLNENTIGYRNSAFGEFTLYSNTTGSDNSAFGSHAGELITTGSNLTCIGKDSQPSSPTISNQITLGNNQITSLRCNVTSITSLSDARDKKNIQELSLGLDFITKLRPRQFNWDKREWYEDNNSDGSKMQQLPTAGFIAQELDSLQGTENAEWLNLVLKDNPEKWEATTGNLLPVMVKAIQELKAENDLLKEKNIEISLGYESLKQENNKLNNRVENIENMLKEKFGAEENYVKLSNESDNVK